MQRLLVSAMMGERVHLRASVCLMAVLLCGAVGCSGGAGDGPQRAPVSGVVTLDGNAVADARVVFEPVDGGPASTGMTGPDGKFSLQIDGIQPGAYTGEYIVRVTTFREEKKFYDGVEAPTDPRDIPRPTRVEPGAPEKIPAKYNEESELKRTVEAGQNEFQLDLTSA
ncbi:carboxypeptidase-like regulatory domain-containing protein [Stratiformator vulcanicus]|uniref:Carboxypeptidase regulatory-like domain-containing protein n=1 Tax=Stratiformator vulcanicus TaxID=2527980 RepID=A0A517QVU6_9PLAN|nr:carboxypeptidase-like regulatory domain-containing protein [Stratiformator vulcanicus]QDT35751.1 hypothetical protein Pan189_01040 [Stratiformator vulcanicus]